MKTFNFVDESQLPMELETIGNSKKAIEVYRKLSKDKHYKVGLYNVFFMSYAGKSLNKNFGLFGFRAHEH